MENKEVVKREQFYFKMQPYFDQNMAREVASTEHFSLLCLGERVYVACPYIMLGEDPFGIYMNDNVMRKIAHNNEYIYPIVNEVLRNVKKNKNIIYDFDHKHFDLWKKWIIENEKVNDVNYSLEEEIIDIMKNKSK